MGGGYTYHACEYKRWFDGTEAATLGLTFADQDPAKCVPHIKIYTHTILST